MKRLCTTLFIAFLIPFVGRAQYDDVSDLPPLDELGSNTFKGHMGGLYPNGSNEMPPEFYNDAIEIAQSIQPLDSKGNPAANGKIGLIGLGASTVTMFSKGIETQIREALGVNREIVFVDCAIGGQDLSKIMIPSANFWKVIDERLTAESITREQVQVMFFQEDNLKNRSADLDSRGKDLVDDFTYMMNFMKEHYPNLRIVYLTGRHTTAFMPADAKEKHREPRAYINGWACKWVIEKQINGDPQLSYKGDNPKSPLIMWGPYFWTQGTNPRQDGYYWGPDLVARDGVHPNDAGIKRVAKDLIQFWSKDLVSQQWFLENPGLAESAEWMQVTVNKVLVDKILYSDLQDPVHIMVMKDTVVIYNKPGLNKSETYDIPLADTGNYKYLISDEKTKAFAGKFTLDEKGDVLITQRTFADLTTDPKGGENALDSMVDSNEPAWIVNGKDKLPKLRRLMAGNENVKAVFTRNGKVMLEIDDALNKRTDLNNLLERGDYTVTFYDENGKEIVLPEDIAANRVRIKY